MMFDVQVVQLERAKQSFDADRASLQRELAACTQKNAVLVSRLQQMDVELADARSVAHTSKVCT